MLQGSVSLMGTKCDYKNFFSPCMINDLWTKNARYLLYVGWLGGAKSLCCTTNITPRQGNADSSILKSSWCKSCLWLAGLVNGMLLLVQLQLSWQGKMIAGGPNISIIVHHEQDRHGSAVVDWVPALWYGFGAPTNNKYSLKNFVQNIVLNIHVLS